MSQKKILKTIFCLMPLIGFQTFAQQGQDDKLYGRFTDPPNSARPRVWWHWMNGNITSRGIRKDLLWMHRSGIGGFQTFDAALVTPKIVDHRLVYMTPEWKESLALTARLADSLGLEMAIAGSPGWSESGGPWVDPRDGMKKIVWNQLTVSGGRTFTDVLPHPPTTTGTFQNIPVRKDIVAQGGNEKELPEFYEDIAVIAYRMPKLHSAASITVPTVRSSGGKFSAGMLTDGDLATAELLPRDDSHGYAWIDFSFERPTTIEALTIVGGGDKGFHGLYGEKAKERSLEASDDGVTFHHICFIPAGDAIQQTIHVPQTTACYFRVSFKNPQALPDFGSALGGGGTSPEIPAGTEIAEIVLHPYKVIDRYEEKSGFAAYSEKSFFLDSATDDGIPLGDIIDLTAKMDENGKLEWAVPEGKWKIIRYGYALTGQQNGPAAAEATGLEVDKLDAVAVKRYFENYLDQYKDASNGFMGERGIGYMVTDSWEAGAANWTPGMFVEFEKRRGYDMRPWMPTFNGTIVKNLRDSEKFLWDFRCTLGELVVEHHYDQLTEILEKRGMKRYSESHESGRAFIADGMEVKRSAAVPMGAIWMPGMMNGNRMPHYIADLKESASVANLYGQDLVAAESLTALGIGGVAWSYSPETLKPIADLAMANGLNRFVIHTSVHQPVDDKMPGLGLGPFGQWFTRNETWAEQAKPWMDYLSRSSYLLQQGKSVADIAYLYGEDNNITNLFKEKLPEIPEGYNYDFVNAEAVLNLLTVKDGLLVTPSGMSYKLLVLDQSTRKMSLSVLRKIAELVKAGAAISGTITESSPSLADDGAEFQKLVNEIWHTTNSRVFGPDKKISQALQALQVTPDFTYEGSLAGIELLYVHRRLSDGDLYWVNNRQDKADTVKLTFRVQGKEPVLWHPESGKMEQVTYRISGGVTTVELFIAPQDAFFILFRKDTQQQAASYDRPEGHIVKQIEGSWRVRFRQKNSKKTQLQTFYKLSSFTGSSLPDIKYFSGTATYSKTVKIDDRTIKSDGELWLDLGGVKDLAEVRVNGKSLGILWKKPFRVNVTDVLKQGSNQIEIEVTNLWANRLIGDAQPGQKDVSTYTTMRFFDKDSQLRPSGLLGPVSIIYIR